MADADLISGLIATYRTLNHGLSGERARASAGDVRESIRALRDSELRFSRDLQERISGTASKSGLGERELPAIGTETENDTSSMLLAQFGTARESTLALLRGLPDEAWDAKTMNDTSIRERVRERLAEDRTQLRRISALLDAA